MDDAARGGASLAAHRAHRAAPAPARSRARGGLRARPVRAAAARARPRRGGRGLEPGGAARGRAGRRAARGHGPARPRRCATGASPPISRSAWSSTIPRDPPPSWPRPRACWRRAGVLLLSVPYWNGVRRLSAPWLAREARRTRRRGGQFYQYAFTRSEVRALSRGRRLPGAIVSSLRSRADPARRAPPGAAAGPSGAALLRPAPAPAAAMGGRGGRRALRAAPPSTRRPPCASSGT